MGHDMLRLDHDIVACAHDLALGEADGVALNDLLDVGLRKLGVRGEEAAQGERW